MEVKELARYMTSVLKRSNTGTDRRLIQRNVSDYYAISIVASELSGGRIGKHRPNLEDLIKKCNSPEEFVLTCSGLNLKVPGPGEIMAMLADIRQQSTEKEATVND